MSLDTLRKHAASLPGATRDIKWGADECYSVGGRMFAVFGIERGKATNCSFNVGPERFLELTDIAGVVRAPYLARARWIQLGNENALSAETSRGLITRSHALIAEKPTRKAREAALGSPPQPPR